MDESLGSPVHPLFALVKVVFISFEGEDILVCFNGKYFIDVLGVLDSEEVSVELNDDEDAAVIRDMSEQSTFLGIIMPMKV